jgi:hypothetical protein
MSNNPIYEIYPLQILDKHKIEILKLSVRTFTYIKAQRYLKEKGIYMSAPTIQYWMKINKIGRRQSRSNLLERIDL